MPSGSAASTGFCTGAEVPFAPDVAETPLTRPWPYARTIENVSPLERRNRSDAEIGSKNRVAIDSQTCSKPVASPEKRKLPCGSLSTPIVNRATSRSPFRIR